PEDGRLLRTLRRFEGRPVPPKGKLRPILEGVLRFGHAHSLGDLWHALGRVQEGERGVPPDLHDTVRWFCQVTFSCTAICSSRRRSRMRWSVTWHIAPALPMAPFRHPSKPAVSRCSKGCPERTFTRPRRRLLPAASAALSGRASRRS